GALLLFADYTVTASLSALDAFHYFGLPIHHHAQVEQAKKAAGEGQSTASVVDAGHDLQLHHGEEITTAESLLRWDSPGLWAIVAILVIGFFNFMGPKHTGGFAIAAAVGMMLITVTITIFALPQIPWSQLPHRIPSLRETL